MGESGGTNPFAYVDKVAIITGGSKGIGAGCARAFVHAGAKVVICARGTETGEAFAAKLTAEGPGACHFELCDVAIPEQIERLIDRTVERYGRLDCLVNNAGYHPPVKRIDEFTLSEWDDVIRTNLTSHFLASKHALPHLRRTGGSIVNMASLVGVMGQ
jgi:NAD(P)-dependent dehydrogenase (short-subunit alcohol dehydrogenase family)